MSEIQVSDPSLTKSSLKMIISFHIELIVTVQIISHSFTSNFFFSLFQTTHCSGSVQKFAHLVIACFGRDATHTFSVSPMERSGALLSTPKSLDGCRTAAPVAGNGRDTVGTHTAGAWVDRCCKLTYIYLFLFEKRHLKNLN